MPRSGCPPDRPDSASRDSQSRAVLASSTQPVPCPILPPCHRLGKHRSAECPESASENIAAPPVLFPSGSQRPSLLPVGRIAINTPGASALDHRASVHQPASRQL